MLSAADVEHFRTFGFVVLRGVLDATALGDELDAALRAGYRSEFTTEVGGSQLEGRYLPMMNERTPRSPSWSTSWHRDTDLPILSVGFAGYLEALDAPNGALRVLPGSHRPGLGAAVQQLLGDEVEAGAQAESITQLPAHVVATAPGDMIALDEHLFHASTGGVRRRQWRVDYFADPVDEAETAVVRAYLESTYLPDWDGGYDVDRFPSYGDHWRASARAWSDRLDSLGAYELAATEEAFARSRVR